MTSSRWARCSSSELSLSTSVPGWQDRSQTPVEVPPRFMSRFPVDDASSQAAEIFRPMWLVSWRP